MKIPRRPRHWPVAAQIVVLAVLGMLLLPWAIRVYGAWWDLAFAPGSFIERVTRRLEP